MYRVTNPDKQSDHCLLVTQISRLFVGLERPVRSLWSPLLLTCIEPWNVVGVVGARQYSAPSGMRQGDTKAAVTARGR